MLFDWLRTTGTVLLLSLLLVLPGLALVELCWEGCKLPVGVSLSLATRSDHRAIDFELHRLGLPHSVGVTYRGGRAIDLRRLASKLDAKGKFERFTWHTGSGGELSARFAMRRVTPCAEVHHELDQRSTNYG